MTLSRRRVEDRAGRAGGGGIQSDLPLNRPRLTVGGHLLAGGGNRDFDGRRPAPRWSDPDRSDPEATLAAAVRAGD